jgi:hypothetical protein
MSTQEKLALLIAASLVLVSAVWISSMGGETWNPTSAPSLELSRDPVVVNRALPHVSPTLGHGTSDSPVVHITTRRPRSSAAPSTLTASALVGGAFGPAAWRHLRDQSR